MNDHFEIKQKANELRKAGNYSEAITIYKELWNNSTVKDKWVGWGFAYCLTHLKEYETALNICNEVFKIDPEFDYIKSVYSQCIYLGKIKSFDDKTSLKSFEFTINDLFQKCEGIEFRNFVDLSIIEFAIFCAKKLKWEVVIKWLKTIDPQKLNTEEFRGTNSEGKHFVKQSPKETYYHKYSKALYETEQFQESLIMSDEGLSYFPNSIWLQYNKAMALRKLKRYQESINLLKMIILKKKEWFLFLELAASYYCLKDYSAAYKIFLEACNSSVRIPTPEYRYELYYLGALILEKQGQQKNANLHTLLSYKLCSENLWKVPDYIKNYISSKNISDERRSTEIFKELSKFWKEEYKKLLPSFTGKINRIFENGLGGFIQIDKNSSIYFNKKDIIGKYKTIEPGLNVKFNKKMSFDNKKNQESEAAFNIEILN